MVFRINGRFGFNSMVSVALTLGMASVALADDAAVFKYSGKNYTLKDLSPGMQHSLFDLELEHYMKVESFVDNAVIDLHVTDLAKKEGKTRDAIEEQLFKVKEPSEKDISTWYEANKQRLPPGYALEQIKGDIKMLLESESRKKVRDDLVVKLKKDKGVAFLRAKPVAPLVEINIAGYPVKGKADAKVTIVEFADYQCPHCKAAGPEIAKVLKKFDGKVRLVFMDYPLNRSGISTIVAHGGVCAKEQNKYWEYHDLAFEKQKDLKNESPLELAQELKLDQAAFGTCMKSKRPDEVVAKAKAEGERIGVTGTPAIFVNGRRIHGYEEKELVEAVEQALKGASS